MMHAAVWCGTHNLHVERVPLPRLLNPRDILIRVTATSICGSDLHLYNGYIPTMRRGDILGHEPVGEIVEVGSEVQRHKVGDRVAVCSIIACGGCWFCRNQEFALCDNSNPNAAAIEKLYNYAPAGIFGYSHLFGGYAGAQAEYLRVPWADTNAFAVPQGVSDEQALAITDAFPTGYMAADLLGLRGGETVAVWGAGPVGQFALKSARLLGAERVIAIDRVPERLELAARESGAETLNFEEVAVAEALREMTAGRGPDACIEACGMEAHGTNILNAAYDAVKHYTFLETDRAHALRQAITSCRKGGAIAVMGVFTLISDKFPLGVAFAKGLRFRMGQQHGQRYIPRLFELTQKGKVDPSFVFTHRFPLTRAAEAYEIFRQRIDQCVKVVLEP